MTIFRKYFPLLTSSLIPQEEKKPNYMEKILVDEFFEVWKEQKEVSPWTIARILFKLYWYFDIDDYESLIIRGADWSMEIMDSLLPFTEEMKSLEMANLVKNLDLIENDPDVKERFNKNTPTGKQFLALKNKELDIFNQVKHLQPILKLKIPFVKTPVVIRRNEI